MQIDGRAFVVTGGASGLGAATAQMLVERGGRVMIVDLARAGAMVAKELGCAYCAADVADQSAAANAITNVHEALGGLHGLINCAGVIAARKVLGEDGLHPLSVFERCVRVNLIGAFNMIRLAAEVMRKAAPNAGGERGVIVNVASIVAFDGLTGQAAYSASKAGVVAMTLPLARELAHYGIRVMAIAPGLFETPMLASLPPAAQRAASDSIPFPKRLGQPREFALLVEQIMGNEMLNGEVIRLDGAIRMGPN